MTKEFDFNLGHVIPNRHCVVVLLPAHIASPQFLWFTNWKLFVFFFLLLAVGEGTSGVTVPHCELER